MITKLFELAAIFAGLTVVFAFFTNSVIPHIPQFDLIVDSMQYGTALIGNTITATTFEFIKDWVMIFFTYEITIFLYRLLTR